MKKFLVSIACFWGISLAVTGQTFKLGENDPKPVKKHKHNDIFSGNGPVVGMNEYAAGIDIRNSSIDKRTLQNPGVAIPVYTNEHYHSAAYGINQTDHMSIIGGFLTTDESKFICGDIINMELAYGHINTDQGKSDYLFNKGNSWFLLDYELGLGFMTNFNPERQFGANFVFVKGSLERSYPNATGRANSYEQLRYRYKRILGELAVEGPGFGFGGLKDPQIIDLSCKLLQRHSTESKYLMAHFIGFSIEYMNGTKNDNTESNHMHMLNFSISCGFIL